MYFRIVGKQSCSQCNVLQNCREAELKNCREAELKNCRHCNVLQNGRESDESNNCSQCNVSQNGM